MSEFALLKAARHLNCTPHWLQLLVDRELVGSACEYELDTYLEKEPVIHDNSFNEWFAYQMLAPYYSI